MHRKRVADDRRYELRFLPEPVGIVPEDYLSLTIDTSLALGGRWWGPGPGMSRGVALGRTEPLDLESPRLRALAVLMAPAMLRIGGTEADRVAYRLKKKGLAPDPAPAAGAAGPDHELSLGKKLWKRINGFARDSGFGVLFVVSAGPADRDSRGAWLGEAARGLIEFSASRDFPVRAWELGNEVNGFPFMHGWRHRVGAKRYSADFSAFSALVREHGGGAVAAGPASAVWPLIGEPNAIIPGFARSGALRSGDILSWHWYPQQSSRGRLALRRAKEGTLLSPRRLDAVLRPARRIAAAARGREVWMTETGHALYGGERGLSDTHLSSLWWLDQLGLLAREGVKRVFRQALVGSDYGLLDQEDFGPRPDFYASFLWKRMMGGTVLGVQALGPDRLLRLYLHSSAEGEGVCLLAINLGPSSARLDFSVAWRRRCVVSPLDGLCSRRLALNGVPLGEDLLFRWGRRSTERAYRIAALDGCAVASAAEIPAWSYGFIEFPSGAR